MTGLVQRLRHVYWLMERRIVPGLRSAQRQYEEALDRCVQPSIRWLDVGCGRRLLGPWRSAVERALVARSGRVFGVDPDLASLRDNGSIPYRCLARAGELPFRSGSFDLVTANMVVEHLRDPEHEIAEVWRLLADGGVVVLHTPNRWAFPTMFMPSIPQALKHLAASTLEGRPTKDVFPAYYRINSSSTIRDVAERRGFEVVSIDLISSAALFALVPPLAALELLWIRLLSSRWAARARPNIIAVLRKRAGGVLGAAGAPA
ncbi:MAG: class I SAM-dependent methyltransferase [Gemmatimonadaceae bacterium]